ncbi:MAG TPA: CHAT domain-containing tetratricopeptide repeat protein [Archangium sp.]|jgi:CHAT domain-containing protein|uniref:CHAT domain-containing protein n=1 Tax=Archangium sp. TaxID=1872627 RepID=UPI002ED9D547
MRRAIATTVLLVLFCTACATVGSRMSEAQKVLGEAQSLEAAGRDAEALPLFNRALVLWSTSTGGGDPWVANCLESMGNIRRRQGMPARAAQMYTHALSIRERVFGKSHPDTVKLRQELIEVHLSQKDLSNALPFLETAFAASEEFLRQELLGFSESHLTSVLLRLRAEEERLYALAREHPEDARIRQLALTAAILRKGRSAEEISNISRSIYRGLVDVEDRATFERLRELRAQLTQLSFAGPGTGPLAEYQQRLKDLSAQGAALEAGLAKRSATLRALRALPAPTGLLESVKATLPRDGALVEFITYNYRPVVPKPDAPPSSEPSELRYLALMLLANGDTSAIDLGPAETLDGAALRLLQALARGSESYESLAREFHGLTFQHLAPHLGTARRLFLSPDGQLSLIPFAVLHDGKRFLVDTFDITYLTSGKDLLPRSEAEDILLPRSVVVLADPDFNALPARPSAVATLERSVPLEDFFSTARSELDQSWLQLPGTRKEAEAIQRLLPQARILMGHSATKAALLRMGTPGVLHIATHGFFLEDDPAPAGARAVKAFGAVGASGPTQRPADPLLRSGLVLSGADDRATPSGTRRREDSLVTALELAGLNLWGTQLVVLSACETGRGDIKLGQGVYGLRRALVVAGAETLVTSLWKVNDETTHQLMEGYYRNLMAGQGRATALRDAMRTLRQKQPHPHFWAPFIAIGRDGPLRDLRPPRNAQSD